MDTPTDELSLLKALLKECIECHPRNVAGAKAFRPTWLLNLKHFSGSCGLALVNGREIPSKRISHITLSHCWGLLPSRTAIITMANPAERRVGIILDKLPLTYQDAINITRSLDIR